MIIRNYTIVTGLFVCRVLFYNHRFLFSYSSSESLNLILQNVMDSKCFSGNRINFKLWYRSKTKNSSGSRFVARRVDRFYSRRINSCLRHIVKICFLVRHLKKIRYKIHKRDKRQRCRSQIFRSFLVA